MAALSGSAFDFSLARTLKKGPVVLYFYPKAFASECTIEARGDGCSMSIPGSKPTGMCKKASRP